MRTHNQTQPDTAPLVILDKEELLESKESKGSFKTRAWGFTHFQTQELEQILSYLNISKCKYVFQQEKCPETKRLHYQGCMYFSNARTFVQIQDKFQFNKLYAARSWGALQAYCQKVETSTGQRWSKGIKAKKKPLLDPVKDLELFPWQQEIKDLIGVEPNFRKIHWYWEPTGNVGKTSFARHMCINFNCLCVGGKPADIKYAIAKQLEKRDIDIVFIDLARSNEGRISYQALEEIKAGMFFSTKYESGQVIFNPPHLVVFANWEPDMDELSLDRWKVTAL